MVKTLKEIRIALTYITILIFAVLFTYIYILQVVIEYIIKWFDEAIMLLLRYTDA